MKTHARVAILGAGLSGLSIGYFLKKKGISADVFEKGNRIGGVIQSNKEAGFLYEHGPNTGVLSNTIIEQLFADISEHCTIEVANEAAKKRLILKNGKWHALPSGLFSGIGTPLFTTMDKFRILGEPFRKAGTNPDENLRAFVERRLGKSFHDYAVAPFINGIYAGNTEQLVPKYALPKLYALEQEFGSFIKGSIQKQAITKKSHTPNPSKKIFSCKDGLESLITALAHIQNNTIYTSCNELSIIQNKNSYTLSTVHKETVVEQEYDYILSTLPSYQLANTFAFLTPQQKQIFNTIEYAPVIQISLGFTHWDGIPLTAFGGLCPPKEQRNILGVLFPSSMFPNRAPKHGALLSVFLGGMLNKNILQKSDEELISITRTEIMELFRCKTWNPRILKIHRHTNAIAQYTRFHKQVYAMVHNLQRTHPHCILAGSFINGISIADRVKQAFDISELVS